MITDKNNLIAARLLKYSTFASSVLLLQDVADAQTVLTDIDPDMVISIDISGLGSDDMDSIDMNGDGIYDFRFNMLFDMGCYVCGNSSFAQITALGSNAVGYTNQTIYTSCFDDSYIKQIVPSLYAGEIIGDDEVFDMQAQFFALSPNIASCQVDFAGNAIRNSQYVPVKLQLDGESHYGWIRLDLTDIEIPFVLHERKLIIRDCAYNTVADEPIEAEALFNTSAVWEYAFDADDNTDGSDISFAFYPPESETEIAEYRVIAVKATSPDITLDEALLLTGDNYVTIFPDGSAIYEGTFSTTSADADGDIIANNNTYKFFILSYPVAGETPHLSSASDTMLMKTDIDPLSIEFNITGDMGDATDFNISFLPSETEVAIAEYRVMMSKDEDFDAVQAELVTSENYHVILPDGLPFSANLPHATTDTEGDTVTYGVTYKTYIYEVDNGKGTGSVLSSSTSSRTISGETAVPQNVVISDHGENGNASDIKVTFDQAEHEATIEFYEVIIVPADSAADFTLSDAESVGAHYEPVFPTGEDLSVVLPYFKPDAYGHAIIPGIPYAAFVMARAGYHGTTNKLSLMSNIITLNEPLGVGGTETAPFIMIYENGELSVNATGGAFKSATLFIYNMEGRNMYKDQLSADVSNFRIALPESLYIVVIRTESGNFTGKIFSGR